VKHLYWSWTLAIIGIVALSTLFTGATHGAVTTGGVLEYKQGLAAANAGHYAVAAGHYEQAILRGYNDPDTYYKLGVVYTHLKRWNDAAWAVAQALTDPGFSAQHQIDGPKELVAISAQGGVNEAPPAILRKATMSASQAPAASPRQAAIAESQSAFTALQTGTFFVGPSYNTIVTYKNVGALSKAAADLYNNSNTTAKFAYLVATPADDSSLAVYTKRLFTALKLQRAVVVVTTPGGVSAYTDRLDNAVAQKLAAGWVGAHSSSDAADLAAGVARAVVSQADSNDDSASRRSAVIGVGVFVLVLVIVGAAVCRVAGWNPLPRVARTARR
jgi:hypothetical protein